MSPVEVRPFRRGDREQLTALVNAHVQAVVPGVSVSVNTVMTQLERDPGEFIVDPWVDDRVTLVAEQRGRVVAAAHLLRYGGGEEVGESYRGAGEISWLLHWPQAGYWPDSVQAAHRLAAACLARLRSWGAARWLADGALPAPAVYGVPEQWPRVREIHRRAGFVHRGRTEVVLLASVDELPRGAEPPRPAARLRRRRGARLPGAAGPPRLPRAHPDRPRLGPRGAVMRSGVRPAGEPGMVARVAPAARAAPAVQHRSSCVWRRRPCCHRRSPCGRCSRPAGRLRHQPTVPARRYGSAPAT
jgi:hypothetical protein